VPNTTISNTVTTTVILGSAEYASAVTVEGTGAITPTASGANAVYGNSAGVSLTDYGQIYGASGTSGGAGVILGANATGATIIIQTQPSNDFYGRIGGGSGTTGNGGDGIDMKVAGTVDDYSIVNGGYSDDASGGVGIQALDGGTLGLYGVVGGGQSTYGAGGVGIELTGGTLIGGRNTGTTDATALLGGSAGGAGVTGGAGAILNDSTATLSWGSSLAGGGSPFDVAAGDRGGVGVDLTASTLTLDFGRLAGGESYHAGAGAYVRAGSTLISDLYANLGLVSTISGGFGPNGGAGVVVYSGGTLENNRSEIYGGAGFQGGSNGGKGGAGGAGVILEGTATVFSSGKIRGGIGANAVNGDYAHTNAGVGVDISGGGKLTLTAGYVHGGREGPYGPENGADAIDATGTSTDLATINIYSSAKVEGGYSNITNGGIGVQVGVDATLKNAGTISGGYANPYYADRKSVAGVGGIGVQLQGVNAYAYNQVGGSIQGGYGADESAGGSGVSLVGQGSVFKNDGTITGGNAYGQYLAITGKAGMGAVVGTGTTLDNYGTIDGGTGKQDSPSNDGVWVDGGTVNNFGSIASPSGMFGTAAYFGESRGTLVLETGGSLTGGVYAFRPGDAIDFQGLTYTTSGSPSNGTYEVGTPGNGTLAFTGNYTGENFVFTSIDGGLETQITLEASCYRRGTRIRCERGERRIERLREGDRVATWRGTFEPIRWIGRRSYTGWYARGNPEVLPVLIRAGALAEGIPTRDLWVSPGHAMFLDGMLIAARDLVNGESICQESWVEEVTYFHLEFERHEILFAEAASSESFVDDDSRQHFDNAAEYWLRYPDARFKPASFCAPRVEEGHKLQAIRYRLAARAGAVSRSRLRQTTIGPQAGHGSRKIDEIETMASRSNAC